MPYFTYYVDEDYVLSESQVAILSEAMEQVKETVNRAASSHRDLHSSVSKVGKAIDRVSFTIFTLWGGMESGLSKSKHALELQF